MSGESAENETHAIRRLNGKAVAFALDGIDEQLSIS